MAADHSRRPVAGARCGDVVGMSAVGMAEAFTGLGALGREGRSVLAGVLCCSPDRLEQASLGDLTDRRHRQRLAAAVASAVEVEPVLSSLAGRALSELAPAAASLPDGEVATACCPARLVRPLRHYAELRWSCVLALRLGDALGWPGVGPRGAAQLVGLAVERGLHGLADQRLGHSPVQALADLEALARYEDPDGRSIMRSALVELSGGRHPAEVRSAASRLLGFRGATAGKGSGTAGLVEALETLLSAAGAARDRAAFEARELALGERPTLQQLARRLRLSQERVRQLRLRAAERVRAAADEGPECVAGLIAEVRAVLGVAVPATEAGALLAELGAGPLAAAPAQLALWLAGPYRPVRAMGGWLAIEPDGLVTSTKQMLGEDGGVRLARQVGDELAALGVVEGHRDAWLAACGALLADDMVVSTAGAPGDVVERLLFAAGTPLTAAELGSLLPGGPDHAAAALRRDTRFAPSEERAGAFGLAEWRAPAAPPPPSGGRRRGQPARPDRLANGVPSLDGRYWLRLVVDEAVFAGRSQPAPADLADAVGVAPGHRRTFAGRYGPICLVNEGGEPSLASLRPVALACGATAGDTLLIGFSPDGGLTVKLHTGEAPAPEHHELAQGGS
jgi:hypothetical protein